MNFHDASRKPARHAMLRTQAICPGANGTTSEVWGSVSTYAPLDKIGESAAELHGSRSRAITR